MFWRSNVCCLFQRLLQLLSFAASWCPQTPTLTLPPMWWAARFRPDFLQPDSYSLQQSCFLYFPLSLLTVLQQKLLWLLPHLPLPLNVFIGLLCFELNVNSSVPFQRVFAFCSLYLFWLSSTLWLPCGLFLFIIFLISFPVPKKMSSS